MSKSGPSSKDEFEEALDELIAQAYQNGVKFDNGGHVFQYSSEELPDIEIMFYRLSESSDENK